MWSLVDTPEVSLDWSLNGVYFISSDEGWIVGHDRLNKRGVLFHYVKGEWTTVDPPDVSRDWKLSVVYFASADEGWAGGYDNSNKRGVLLEYSHGSWNFDSHHIAGSAESEIKIQAATSLAPLVTTGSYRLTGNLAQLNGSLNLHGSPGNWWFEVNGAGIGYHSVRSPSNSTFSPSEVISVNPNTTYKYRICANNAAGQRCGELRSFKVPGGAKVATPMFSPAPGDFTGSVIVTISCDTSGATIRYTTDGSDPTSSSSQYSSPLTLTSTTILKARAFKRGMTDSDVASGTYAEK